MDLTTLTLVFMLVATALGADAVWHPRDVVLQASAAGKIEKATIDENMMNTILMTEVDRISLTPSVMAKPKVQLGGGIAVAIASAVNLQPLVTSLQTRFGRQPDEIKVSLFGEDGAAKVLVTGSGREQVATFEQEIAQQKGETIVALLHRAALIGMARIDPYLTALNLMGRHASDKDFTDVQSLINFAKSQIPPTPVSFQRSLFENLQGIVTLFVGNQQDAYKWFALAVKSSPDNTVAALNLAFATLQLGQFEQASEQMQQLMRHPPIDKTLLCTAYMTWGAARLGMHDPKGADAMLAVAIESNPNSAIAWDLWADVKRENGDDQAAADFRRKALETSASFENYAEVAALYFQLAWHDKQPVTRSMFINPPTVSFH